MAQFAPPGKFHVSSESVVGDVTVPGSYLHSAFVVQSGSNEDDVWIADSGASCHMTRDRTRGYNVRPTSPGRETFTIGDRRRIKVEYIGNMDVIFHRKSDQRITLIDVAYVPGLGFNLYSLHVVQRTHLIVSDASGTHIIGANLTFPRSNSESYLRATRLPAGTVGARRRQGEMHVTNLLKAIATPRSASAFARRHLALLESTMGQSGPDYANKTADGYLRPYAEICARRRAVSCTSRRSASSRTGIDDTACIGIETPGSDPPARWPRRRKRGKRGDAGEDPWRDPCNA